MLLPGDNIAQTWLFFLVLASWIIAFGDAIGDKTLNLKIGFDLTQGNNGAPSLRIRDFQDDIEFNHRADDHSDEKRTSPRADSLSDSDGKNSDKSKEGGRSAKSAEDDDDDDEYSENDKQRSTRGLKPGDYEPEDNPKIHGKYVPEESDSDPASM